jgi:thiol-disulfide isomerase/thioredoxin
VRIALIAAGTIYGSIREVDGSLATAYSVSAIPVDPALNRPTHHTGFNYRGTEGKYFCGSLPLPGKYRVLANGLSRQSRRISVLGPLVVLDKENVAQRVDLTFPRGIDVTGEVTDLKGRPLSGVNVSLNFVLDPSVGQYARGTGSVRTSDNGAFTIPNVAFSVPGTYALHVYRQDFKRRKTVEISPEAIPLTIPFDPREGSEGRGTMRPIRPQPLSIGDVSPEFSFKAVDGQSMKLSDFRGRFVLLYFWATWCGPCKLETPHLKVVHEAFGADRRLAMISLSLDSGPSAPKQYAKENDLQWIQGFLGDWTTTEVPDQYGVQGIPEIILLDPQGRVLRTDLRGEKTLSAVRQALQDK